MVVQGSSFVQSIGMAAVFGSDIRLPIQDMNLAATCEALLDSLAEYCRSNDRKFSAGDTVAWATSVMKFSALDAAILSASALDLESDVFRDRLDELLRCWLKQQHVCQQHKSPYIQTGLASMAVVSPDVLEGTKIHEAVRYPFAGDNCGWWIFGEAFSGDLASMKVAHLGHALKSDERIRPYLGLAPGYAVRPSQGEVWFEAEVAAREPV